MMLTLENVMNAVKNGLTVLRKMPKIFRFLCVISIGAAIVAMALGLTSCGSMSKITIKSDPNNISIAVNQTSKDSTAVNVNVNPTLRFYEKQEDETSSGKDG